MDKNTQKHLELISKHLCDDLDADACKELMDVLKASKDCRIYFDTVKKAVVLCREKECPEDLPEDINQRLFEVLGLENYKDAR
jgi:hypothetical protein